MRLKLVGRGSCGTKGKFSSFLPQALFSTHLLAYHQEKERCFSSCFIGQGLIGMKIWATIGVLICLRILIGLLPYSGMLTTLKRHNDDREGVEIGRAVIES